METASVGDILLYEDIVASEKLRRVDKLLSDNAGSKTGGKSLGLAFSPDNEFFAWSCGRFVFVILYGDILNHRPFHFHCYVDFLSKPLIFQCDSVVRTLAMGVSQSVGQLNNDDGSPRRPFHNINAPENRLILAVGLNSGRIRIYSIYSGKFLMELMDHKETIEDLKFFNNCSSLILLSASRDCTLKLWNLNDDGNMFKTLTETNAINCCDWSSDGKYVASGGDSKLVTLYDCKTWKVFRKLVGHLHRVVSCNFSPDGALLASSSFDTTLILWNHLKSEQLFVFCHLTPRPRPIYAAGANDHYVRCSSYSPDSCHLATVCDDNYLRIWDVCQSERPLAVAKVENPVYVCYSPNGFYICVGTNNGTVHTFTAPMKVPTLFHACRRTIRRMLSADEIRLLPFLPMQVKRFLLYEDFSSYSGLP